MTCPAVLVAMLLATAPPAGIASAQPAGDITAATEVVMRQLDAFRRNDFDTAYTFASTMIRDMFDRQAFERMVRTGYPEIASSVSAFVSEFVVAPNGGVYLRLRIGGVNGNRIEAIYEMIREDGHWRINGVVAKPDASEPA
jgi:hypothetical protein